MRHRTPVVAGLILVWCAGTSSLLRTWPVTSVAAQSQAVVQAPRFEVDTRWPKPLPNHWVLGSTIGLSVDADDHVWILHRPETVEDNFKAAAFTPAIGECCVPAQAGMHGKHSRPDRPSLALRGVSGPSARLPRHGGIQEGHA